MSRNLEARLARLESAVKPVAYDGIILVTEQPTAEQTQQAIAAECAAKGVTPATAQVIVLRFV